MRKQLIIGLYTEGPTDVRFLTSIIKRTFEEVSYENKIYPAVAMLESSPLSLCKVIVPLVPVRMTEAWMLADKELLKREIGTDKSNQKLGIHRDPEQYADPKEVVINAIRIAREGMTKRRRHELMISDLYLPLGQSINLDALKRLPSYLKFQENVREAFRKLNYLH